jgi:hypothetical protein
VIVCVIKSDSYNPIVGHEVYSGNAITTVSKTPLCNDKTNIETNISKLYIFRFQGVK